MLHVFWFMEFDSYRKNFTRVLTNDSKQAIMFHIINFNFAKYQTKRIWGMKNEKYIFFIRSNMKSDVWFCKVMWTNLSQFWKS